MSDSQLDVKGLEIAVGKDWVEMDDRQDIFFFYATIRGLDPEVAGTIIGKLRRWNDPWLVEGVSWGSPGSLGEIAAAETAAAITMSDGGLLLTEFGREFPEEPTDEVIIAAVQTILSQAATFVPPVDEGAIAAVKEVIDQPTRHPPPED